MSLVVLAGIMLCRPANETTEEEDNTMAGTVNKVILVGRLGADPEVRSTNSGAKVASLSVATNQTWRDKGTGEKKERTDWHRVVIFGSAEREGLAGVAEQYLRKGDQVYLEGQLQTRKWQDKSGNDRYITEVVLSGGRGQLAMLGSKGDRAGTSSTSAPAAASDASDDAAPPPQDAPTGNDLDDDVPF